MKIVLTLLFNLFLCAICVQGQIDIFTHKKLKPLIFEHFGGEGVEISKVRFRGNKDAIAEFEEQGILGMNRGVLMTTGKARDVKGPNKGPGTSGKNSARGDRFLTKISKSKTHDAAIIELTFIPAEKYITFNFVFASEEYTEYVGSNYNDAFAFLLTGKKGRSRNIALVPDTKTPVAINKINPWRNAQYYVNNTAFTYRNIYYPVDTIITIVGDKQYTVTKTFDNSQATLEQSIYDIEFDGFTKVLQAKSRVRPGQKYRMRIAIADAGDRIVDSGVFIEHKSFSSHNDPEFSYGTTVKRGKKDCYIIDTVSVMDVVIPPPVIDTIRKKAAIYFSHNSIEIRSTFIDKIKRVIKEFKNKDVIELKITGFADPSGSSSYNLKLSRRRALEVRKALIKLGFPEKWISKTIGNGEIGELKPDNYAVEMRKSRKVEIEVTAIQVRPARP